MTTERLTIEDFMRASQKGFHAHLVVSRYVKVGRKVPFQKNHRSCTVLRHCPSTNESDEDEYVAGHHRISPRPRRPSKTWIKVKNPKAPAATRATNGTF